MRRVVLFITFIICLPSFLNGQEKLRFGNTEQSQFQIAFEISQNLIILPLTINDSGLMKFILDTGIRQTIITEMTGIDTVSLKLAREVTLEGLGDGEDLKAWYSEANRIIMENSVNRGWGIVGDNMEVYLIPENLFEFSKQFGLQINGLIGSDFFTHFIVEIDYIHKLVTFYKREDFNYKRRTKRHAKIPLIVENSRPYINAAMTQEDGSKIDLKLLIDTGASMSMWVSLFSNSDIKLPKTTFKALLGQGLSGNISGVNGRIQRLEIGPFHIDKPIVAFPDSAAIAGIQKEIGRNGTLGNEILKRFNVIFDYNGGHCYLKPNKNFHKPFNYNRSGLEIEKPFYNIPSYHIYNVVPGSPADLAGVKKGDQIEMINFIRAINIELDQINSILYGTEGRSIRLQLIRNGERIKTKFLLDNKL